MFLLSLLIVACGLWLIMLIWVWSRKKSALEPPELSGKVPFIGHALLTLGDSIQFFNNLKIAFNEVQEKGGVSRISLLGRKFYCVTDPEDSLKISNTCLQKHYMYNFMKPLLGNGLLTADVTTWKKNRKLLNPAFRQHVLDGYMELFNNQSRRLADVFATQLGKPFDHEHLLRINNLETICSAVTGAEAGDYDNLHEQYLPSLEGALNIVNDRIQKFWYHTDFIFNLSPLRRKSDELVKQMLMLSNSIVQKKKSEMKNPTNTESKLGKLKPFVDLILELAEEHSFNDKYIQEETDTMIAAGHDTTSSSLAFAFTLLGSHVEVQEKAYKEILQVLGNSNQIVHKDDLSKLVYIEAILKEAVRLYPIGPIIVRHLDQDIKLKNYTLKSNTGCLISVYGINRHPMWGSDANEFRPERWLDKETLPDQKYFAAFGLGRRSCIGKVFAMMTMKVTLVHVLRKYRVSSDISKMVIKFDTMIRPVSGFHISLEKRDL